jgi:hypothetical protein
MNFKAWTRFKTRAILFFLAKRLGLARVSKFETRSATNCETVTAADELRLQTAQGK